MSYPLSKKPTWLLSRPKGINKCLNLESLRFLRIQPSKLNSSFIIWKSVIRKVLSNEGLYIFKSFLPFLVGHRYFNELFIYFLITSNPVFHDVHAVFMLLPIKISLLKSLLIVSNSVPYIDLHITLLSV